MQENDFDEYNEYIKKINCKLTDEYKTHEIFDELEKYIKFYNLLSDITFAWITLGTNSLNFDNRILTSIKGTLESIKLILEYGKINDAFSLTRKYQDNVVINVYTLLYLEDNFDYKVEVVEKINNWVSNKEKLPTYAKMNNYIRESKKLKNINEILFKEKHYKNMRQRLNDHTHYNYFAYMFYNDNSMYDRKGIRVKYLNQLHSDIQNILISHFIWLFSIKSNYMMANDYLDYMEMGEVPPENSQYWVSPFIQEIFNEVIKKNRPDLIDIFKESICMELE